MVDKEREQVKKDLHTSLGFSLMIGIWAGQAIESILFLTKTIKITYLEFTFNLAVMFIFIILFYLSKNSKEKRK